MLPALAFADTDSDFEMRIAMPELSMAKTRLGCGHHLLPIGPNDDRKSKRKECLAQRKFHVAE
jgi:hypothetical protein